MRREALRPVRERISRCEVEYLVDHAEVVAMPERKDLPPILLLMYDIVSGVLASFLSQ